MCAECQEYFVILLTLYFSTHNIEKSPQFNMYDIGLIPENRYLRTLARSKQSIQSKLFRYDVSTVNLLS